MKEFELRMRLRNNRLVRLREQLSLSPKEASERIPISYGTLLQFEALKKSPVGARGWTPLALRLAGFYGVEPGWLWPEAVQAVSRPELVVEASADELRPLLPSQQSEVVHALPEGTDERYEDREQRQLAAQALESLVPIERKILEARMIEDEPRSSIAQRYGVTSERVRQLENRALESVRDAVRLSEVPVFLRCPSCNRADIPLQYMIRTGNRTVCERCRVVYRRGEFNRYELWKLERKGMKGWQKIEWQ